MKKEIAITVAVFTLLSAIYALAEGFSLQDNATGKVHGPFQFKDGARVKIESNELTVVKIDPSHEKLVAILKETKIPSLNFRDAAVTDIASFLSRTVKDGQVSIIVTRNATSVGPITLSVGKTTLYNALGLICDIGTLKWHIRNGVVVIDND